MPKHFYIYGNRPVERLGFVVMVGWLMGMVAATLFSESWARIMVTGVIVAACFGVLMIARLAIAAAYKRRRVWWRA